MDFNGAISGSESCSIMSDSLWPHGLYSPWNSLGQNTGVGSLSLLQGTFPTQGSNLGLPHYQLSHKGIVNKNVNIINRLVCKSREAVLCCTVLDAIPLKSENESVSYSIMSDSLQPRGL